MLPGAKHIGGAFEQLALALDDLAGVQFELAAQLGHRLVVAQRCPGYPCLERRAVRTPRTAR